MRKYNIGQYRYSKGQEYLATVDIESIDYDETFLLNLNENNPFRDLKINCKLEKRETYYLSCDLNVFENNVPQNFIIKLKTADNSREQVIGSYNFDKKEGYNSINVVFTPRAEFDKIVFELKRNAIYDNYNGMPRELTFYNDNVSLSFVKNIITSEEFLNLKSNIFKLGVQGNSGLIVCINGEPIRLGQSGMFEVYRDDFEIYSIGFIITGKETSNIRFIMDYCYDKGEEVKG